MLILALLSGCGGKKDHSGESVEHLIYQIDSVDQATGVQRMQVSSVSQDIECGGRRYSLYIHRAPSDSLPRVQSELGTFADNRIVVRITREGGSRVFARTLTKQVFSDFFTTEQLSHFVLEGVVFDEEKTSAGHDIVLASSISYPQTDLYIPFTLTISPEGKLHIARNEDMEELPPLPTDSAGR